MTDFWHTFASRAAHVFLVVLILGTCGRTFAQDPAEEAAAAMEQGQAQLEAGEFDAAVESFGEAIRLTNGAATAFLGRAMARKELGDFAPAQEDLRNAQQYGVSDASTTAAIKNLSGEINLELGAYAEAITDFTEAVEGDPKNPLYQFNLGKLYTLAGAPNQAVEPLTEWLDSGSEDSEKNAEAYRLRAQSQARLSKLDKALGDITASLAIEPDSHESYAIKATILAIDEDYDGSAAAYKQAIEKFVPEEDSDLPYIEAQLQRASILEEAGKAVEDDPVKARDYFDQVRAQCQQLLDALPDRPDVAGVKAAALFRRGVAERLLDELNDAVNSFSEAIDLNPSFAQAYFRRGICYFHQGEELMAIKDFDQAAGIDYETPHAALWKGRTYAQLGEYYEAIKAYGQALAVSDRYTDAYVNRGLTYIHLLEFDRAIADFNDAIRLQPTQAEHYYHRGVAYAMSSDHEHAIKSFAKAIDLNELHSDAHLRLAAELDQIGHSDLAHQYRARGEELSGMVSK